MTQVRVGRLGGAGRRAGRLGRARGAHRRERARERLGGAHRERFGDDALAEVATALRVLELEERLRVAHREHAELDVLLELLRQLEQAQVVRHRRAVEPDALAHLVLRAAAVEQRTEGLRELDRVQVAALHVLDQRDLEQLARLDVLHDGRDRLAARALGCAPAPLADDELERARGAGGCAAHHHRLEHAVAADRFGEPFELALVEAAARLVGIRRDLGRAQLRGRARRRTRLDHGRRRGRRGDQRVEASAERVASHHHQLSSEGAAGSESGRGIGS
jgi:hypothetical protein